MPLLLVLCVLAAALLAPTSLAEGQTFPQVEGLESNNGPESGGNVVTIRGGALSGAQRVTFGAVPAPRFTVESDTEIKAVAPPGSGEVEVGVTGAGGDASPPQATDVYAYDPAPEGPWLGVNGNSSLTLGPVDALLEHGIAWDRSGPTEWVAGETLSRSHGGLQASIDAGMIPDVTIEYRAYEGCHYGEQCLPTSARDITTYVRGFVASAREILARYPAVPIVFEASNEPEGYGSAAQYAAILASLLPAAEQAGLPMTRIYVSAGAKGWISALYAARPALRREIKGWYVHPYNHDRGPQEGIASLPSLQAEMTSGQNNVIVSEMGFCAPDVLKSAALCAAGPAPARNSADAAAALARELRAAAAFHRAGWLRALIVYSRNDRGWAMQLEGGRLTAQGQALEAFADANP